MQGGLGGRSLSGWGSEGAIALALVPWCMVPPGAWCMVPLGAWCLLVHCAACPQRAMAPLGACAVRRSANLRNAVLPTQIQKKETASQRRRTALSQNRVFDTPNPEKKDMQAGGDALLYAKTVFSPTQIQKKRTCKTAATHCFKPKPCFRHPKSRKKGHASWRRRTALRQNRVFDTPNPKKRTCKPAATHCFNPKRCV